MIDSSSSSRSLVNLFLHPKFQNSAILLVLLTAGLALLSLGAFIYVETNLLLKYSRMTGTESTVVPVLWKYGLVSAGLFLLSMILMCVWILLFTHKMIGPINRIKRELDEMYRNKSVHLVTVREEDYLRPLVQKYNQVLWGLSRNSEWDEPSQVPGDHVEKGLFEEND